MTGAFLLDPRDPAARRALDSTSQYENHTRSEGCGSRTTSLDPYEQLVAAAFA